MAVIRNKRRVLRYSVFGIPPLGPPWPSEIYVNCLDQGEDRGGRNMENLKKKKSSKVRESVIGP